MTEHPAALSYADESLRDDRELVLAALGQVSAFTPSDTRGQGALAILRHVHPMLKEMAALKGPKVAVPIAGLKASRNLSIIRF